MDVWTILGALLAIIGVNVTLFAWLRSDIKDIEKTLNDHNKEFGNIRIEIEKEFSNIRIEIEKEFGNVRTDLAIIKTLLLHKECCMIKDDKQMKKAE